MCVIRKVLNVSRKALGVRGACMQGLGKYEEDSGPFSKVLISPSLVSSLPEKQSLDQCRTNRLTTLITCHSITE